MKLLFSPEGEAALAATMALRPLLAFDFDGTLAPIVARPADAGVPLPIARRLERLADMLPVAIITGRSIADVRNRLLFEPSYLIGNHGAEDPEGGLPGLPALFEPLRQRLREQHDRLLASGVSVEDKQHSMALHYRLARHREAAQGLIHELLLGLEDGLSWYGGKCVTNVVAAAAPDKAGALASLVRRCGAVAAIFVGDDVNDEPVFARGEPSWLTVRVGRDEPTTQARYCIDSAGGVNAMLDRMILLATRTLKE